MENSATDRPVVPETSATTTRVIESASAERDIVDIPTLLVSAKRLAEHPEIEP